MQTTTIPASVIPSLALSREAVEQLAERLAEPAWLAERRRAAWEAFEATPMPTLQDEEWRRTDVRRLDFGAFALPAAPPTAYEREASDDHRSGFVQVADGFVVEAELDPALAARGVILAPLAEAARAHPELVEPYLDALVPPGYSKFAALAGALGAGVFAYVPAGVDVELPVQVSHTLTAGGAAVFPRTLLVTGANAAVTLIERNYAGDHDAPSLSSGTVELFAGDGARVRYVHVQEWGRNHWSFLAQRQRLGRDAQLNSLSIALGGRFTKANNDAVLAGAGGSAEVLGLTFANERQFFDAHTLQEHAAPSCYSDLLYKTVLRDTSRSVFSGLIQVRPGSAKTDAYQTSRNLLLSENARADAIPNLEIENNDVKCSHGASVGPIDEDQLFYLQARGISRRDAERLIVDGFFEPLVSRIPLEGVRERLQVAIDRKMGE